MNITRYTWRRSGFLLLTLGLVGGMVTLTWSAKAQGLPFSETPVAGHVAALSAAAVRAPVDLRVPPEARPRGGVHRLGSAGYIWKKDGLGFCTMMKSGSGSCFASFAKPLVLYLTGTQSTTGTYSNARAEGIVPDAVEYVTLHMSGGAEIGAPIASNAFSVDVPAGEDIMGYSVRLSSGQTFYRADEVLVPRITR
jgi:hypothetical protein